MDIELYKKAFEEYNSKKNTYDKMYKYYKGESDAISNYKNITERANLKVNTNYIKKFIKEEVSYSIGNDISYISKSGNIDMSYDIDYYLENLDEKHDIELLKNMLIFGQAFEVYYIDNKQEFNSRIISPLNGYVAKDDFNNVTFFMHIFNKKFDENTYIDVYLPDRIEHYDNDFNKVAEDTIHYFGDVPVGIACISEEMEKDTIYADIKGLQDAYETNLSDIANEISDFRNSYLKVTGAEIDKEEASKMKSTGIIQVPEKGSIDWLIKNINDSFIQNTLNTLEDKMYQLTFHINHNEKMQSNTSSLALRSRLISLEEKCKLNQKALSECIKSRLRNLFIYLKKLYNKNYDYRDIKVKFVANVPQDDLMTAQIISQLGDKISLQTALAQLSFVENPIAEVEKIKTEQEEIMQGEKLLDDVITNE